MKKEIVAGIIVGLLIPALLGVFATFAGWLPSSSDYRIPKGLVKGRVIMGCEQDGQFAVVGQTGGTSFLTSVSNILEPKTASLGDGNNNYLRLNSSGFIPGDGRPPFIALLICVKK